jgi:hypothetical protein
MWRIRLAEEWIRYHVLGSLNGSRLYGRHRYFSVIRKNRRREVVGEDVCIISVIEFPMARTNYLHMFNRQEFTCVWSGGVFETIVRQISNS